MKTIVESVGGKVIARTGNCVRIEMPTDKVVGLVRLCREGCFLPIFREQQFRCGTPSQAFYVYDIDLAARGSRP